jgi:hypothetical protein
MNQNGRRGRFYPPHPEEGASTCVSERRNRRVAPVSKDGAATDLGFTRDRQLLMRKSGKPDLRGRRSNLRHQGMCK